MTERHIPPLENEVPRYRHKKRKKPFGLRVKFEFPWRKSINWNQWYARKEDRAKGMAELDRKGYEYEVIER